MRVRPADREDLVVTDPGRALISGKCADIGKVKGPILRGLAGRAPYFHNGSAATLLDAVNFYNLRFNIGLTRCPDERLGRVSGNPVATKADEGLGRFGPLFLSSCNEPMSAFGI